MYRTCRVEIRAPIPRERTALGAMTPRVFWDRRRMIYSRFVSLRATVVVRVTPTSGPVAQLAEQQTLNLLVEGSIPSGLTITSSIKSIVCGSY